MRQCKKQTVVAVIMKDKQFISMGINDIYEEVSECPRDVHGFKSGKGYHLCTEVCKQKHHAEVAACYNAGKAAVGGTLYLIGHSYACDECLKVMTDHGIDKVVFTEKGSTLFLPKNEENT